MNNKDLDLINRMAEKLAVYIPWDCDYDEVPLLFLDALIDRVKSLEIRTEFG